MFCRKCGQELKSGAKFCTKCGTPVAQGAPQAQQPGQAPPVQQPGQTQPVQQPGQVPPMQQPGQTQPVQQPGQVQLKKEAQQLGQIPPRQTPPPGQMRQTPPSGQAGGQIPPRQTPPGQAGGQIPPGGQMPPGQMGGQIPPRQMPPQQTGQMPQNAPKKKKTGLIIALVCVIILAIAVAAAVGVILYFRGQSDSDKEDESRIEREIDDTEHQGSEMKLPEEQGTENSADSEAAEGAAGTEAAQAPETVPEETKPEKPKSHDYQFVVGDVTWTEAFQKAQEIPGGHLLNINSEKEWKKIIKKIKEEDMEGYVFWIGATRRGNSRDYLWVDASGDTVGEPMNENEHWLAGEPSFYDDEFGVEERYVNLFYSSTEERWVCNDTADDVLALLPYYSGKLAYIVEIEYE